MYISSAQIYHRDSPVTQTKKELKTKKKNTCDNSRCGITKLLTKIKAPLFPKASKF